MVESRVGFAGGHLWNSRCFLALVSNRHGSFRIVDFSHGNYEESARGVRAEIPRVAQPANVPTLRCHLSAETAGDAAEASARD